MEFRSASRDDYDLLLPLFLGLREFSRAGHPPQGDDFELVLAASRSYLDDVLQRGPDCLTILALESSGLAGYAVVTVHDPNPLSSAGVVRTGSIDELFIDRTHRGKGVGTALVEHACDWLASQDADRVEVGAYAWNTASIAFYEREGFTPWTITLAKPIGQR